MGQKVNPIGLRLGINRTWDSRWFAETGEYADLLHEDLKIREYIHKKLAQAGISKVIIERPAKKARITIHTARPGVVIGKKGVDIEKLRVDIAAMTGGEVHLNIVEIRKPEIDAQLVAENIAQQLERRVAFRRAMKRAVASALKAGAEGVRVESKGRLGGSDMGRREWYREGRVPLHTLRADIDYGFREARTTAGRIGVKVWIYKGDILPYKTASEDKISAEAAMAVGETSGQATPRQVVSSTAARRQEAADEKVAAEAAAAEAAADGTADGAAVEPLVKEADPELERLIAEEEAIEASLRDSSETPHFRPQDAD